MTTVRPRGPRTRRPDDVAAWLRTGPSLHDLREAFPQEWSQVERRVARLVATGDDEALRAYLTQAAVPAQGGRGHARKQTEVVADAVRRHMTLEAVRQAAVRAETGVDGGRVRLGLVSGWVLQRLLFDGPGLRRKAVSWTAFRVVWPLVPHRRRLMALVRPRGIYCFYARPLLRGIREIVGDRPVLEIAAGDGTLARLLAAEGVDVTATDDHSWQGQVDFDGSVLPEDAATALRTRRPSVVLCAWPPPGNPFERKVFATESVDTYVVLTTTDETNAGDWTAYRGQTGFELTEHERLGRYLLPHGGRVLVFRRRPAGD